MTTWVGMVTCELFLPGAQSLKDKRRTVKSLVDRMHARFRVSVAETGMHELHQRVEVSIAVVSGSGGDLEQLLFDLRSLADNLDEAVVARWDAQVLEGVE